MTVGYLSCFGKSGLPNIFRNPSALQQGKLLMLECLIILHVIGDPSSRAKWQRSNEQKPSLSGLGACRPQDVIVNQIVNHLIVENRSVLTWDLPLLSGLYRKTKKLTKVITLGGGSLGSCVDEERSQLRELM